MKFQRLLRPFLQKSGKLIEHRTCAKWRGTLQLFGAMQKCANLMESRLVEEKQSRSQNMLQTKPLVARIGFDTSENGPSKIWATDKHPTRPRPPPSKKHLWKQYFRLTSWVFPLNG